MYLLSPDGAAPMRFGKVWVDGVASADGGGPSFLSNSNPVPPSLLYIHKVLGLSVVAFETTINCPSGAQSGDTYELSEPSVTAFAWLPSTFIVQTFSEPLRSLRNTRRLPSGEKRGWLSNAIPPLISFASPPDEGIV